MIWPAGVALSLWVWGSEGRRAIQNKDVLELGAGMGLPGCVAAALLEPASVALTDSRSGLVDNLQASIDGLPGSGKNGASAAVDVSASTLNWQHVYQEDNSVAPGTRAAVEKASSEGSVDVVVGSDVIYYFPDVRPLSHTVAKLLRPGGEAFVFGPAKRVVLNDLRDQLQRDGLTGSGSSSSSSSSSSSGGSGGDRSSKPNSPEVMEFDFLAERLSTLDVAAIVERARADKKNKAADDDDGEGEEEEEEEAVFLGEDLLCGESLSALQGLPPVAYGVGDGAGTATGAGCEAAIDEEQVLFWDTGGAWVDAQAWTSGAMGAAGGPLGEGEATATATAAVAATAATAPPCQQMVCIRATKPKPAKK